MNKLFPWLVRRREAIISIFKLLYIFLFGITLLATLALYKGFDVGSYFLGKATLVGQTALIIYSLTLIPGIFRRLGWKSKIVSLIMIFRRYLGILMFFLVFYHFMMMRGASIIQFGERALQLPVFEIVGLTAFLIVTALATTSNDLSTAKLGVWWGRIHNLTYILVWVIFLHVALQTVNIWTLLIGSMSIIEVLSFVYPMWKKSQVEKTRNQDPPIKNQDSNSKIQ